MCLFSRKFTAALITLGLISRICTQPTNHQLVRCIFIVTTPPNYSCRIFEAVIISEILPVIFYGDNHIEGRNDSHVTHFFTTRETPTFIRVFTKAVLENYVNIQHVQIEWARLERIADDAFENCGLLERFEGDDNPEFNALPTTPIFRNCQHLRILSFMNCNLSSIPNTIVQGLTNLEILRFTGNRITTIHSALLTPTPNLRSLSFASNPLFEVPVFLFRGLTQLEILELWDVNIQIINIQWFIDMPNLRTLILSHNRISHIQFGVFGNLQRLEVLFLLGNQLSRINAFGNLQSLIHLNVNSNQLNAIEPTFFNNFPNLDVFESLENICINQRVENVSGIDFNTNPIFNVCFGNWNEPPTTTTTTTLAPPTTTPSSAFNLNPLSLLTLTIISTKLFI